MNDRGLDVTDDELPGWPPFVSTWILPYLGEPGLWPVLVAILGHVVVLIAPMLLGIWRGAAIMAVPLTAVLMGSFSLIRMEVRSIGRPRWFTFTVVGCWVGAVLVAYITGVNGIF